MIIDVHAHIAPSALLDAARREARAFPSVKVESVQGGTCFAFAGGEMTRPVAPKLIDMDARLQWMQAQGITHQVAGGWLDMFGYELPPAEGLAWSRLMNEHLLAASRAAKVVSPLATVPMQDGAMAAQVLVEALDAGFAGVMIGTQPKGIGGNLDDPALDPFWSAAAERQASVYIHPMYVCGDDRLKDYDLVNAVARVTDTTIAVARLLYSGHLVRYAGVNVVLSHGGGALPYILGRLVRTHQFHRELADPNAGFEHLYFDTVMFDPAALRFLADKVGADKLMLGSDYPFPIGDLAPLGVVRRAGLSEIDVSSILGSNAARLFRLECGCS
ncbi:MAG: amidohydrolase [Burkholderiales bacterium]|nr:amidohydrolase [Burkholderiales bacterium]